LFVSMPLTIFHAMGAGAGFIEFGKAVEGGVGDFVEGVVGEEGLMSGDEDIGEGEEPGEDVVREDVGGVVGEKKSRFLLIDIDGESADLAAFEALDDRVGIKNGSAAGVDEDHPFFHPGEGYGIHQVTGGGKERDVKSQQVGFTKNLLQANIAGQVGHGGVGSRIVGEKAATEAMEVADHLLSDRARAHHPDGLLFEFESLQALQFEIVIPDPLVGARNVAGEGKHKSDGEFGDGMGGVGRDGGHRDPQFPGGRDIDAGAECGDDAGAALGEDLEGRAVDPVVDEDDHRRKAVGQGGGEGIEASFEKVKVVLGGDLLKGLLKVASVAEDQSPHAFFLGPWGVGGKGKTR
jgi:hypothetical protein